MLSRQSRFPVLRERQRQLCHASLAGLTQEVCLKGLHQMKGDNLMIRKGRGACLARWKYHATHPPIVANSEQLVGVAG